MRARARLIAAGGWLGVAGATLLAHAGTVEYTTIDDTGRRVTVRKKIEAGEIIKIENPLLRASAPTRRPWTVDVQSTYTDEATGQPHAISGGGTLVMLREGFRTRYFVQTASHVSQGQNLQLKTADRERSISLEVVRRYADVLADVEFVEVRASALKPEMALASYDVRAGRFYIDEDWTEGWGTIARNPSLMRRLGKVFVPGPIQPVGVGAALTLPAAVTATPSAPASRFWLLAGERQLAIDASTAPGTSGSSLVVQSELDSRWILVGPALSTERFGKTSFFPSPNAVATTFQSLLAGRTTAKESEWRVRNGLTSRRMSGGSAEVVDASVRLVGNGADRDGGNGENRDGGNGSIRDGGNGSLRDGGDGPASGASIGPIGIWKSLGIQPGILWQGQPALALKVTRKGTGDSVTLFGDVSALLLIRDRFTPAAEYGIERVPPASDFIALLREKAGGAAGDFRLESRAGSTIEVRGDEITLRLAHGLTLRLGRDGRLREPATDGFYPIIQAKDDQGRSQVVDLRDLFAREVSHAEARPTSAFELTRPCGADCSGPPMAWDAAEFGEFARASRAPRIGREIFDRCVSVGGLTDEAARAPASCQSARTPLPEAPEKLGRDLHELLKTD